MFVDTGAWMAVLNPRDPLHRRGLPAYERLLRAEATFVTTNLVVAEAYIGLRRGAGTDRALAFLDLVRSTHRIEKVYATEELEMAAEQILRQYSDHEFSYTDAVSFALMRERRLTTAFAFDRHFLVAGFQLMPPLA